ncbi:uncharacterized protein C4orf3 homolog [Carlito syrichta]|uniref:Uncharacterized protein C4orf3 homolog n=1 Tax=Carlito syrichta TaxID=1868482 RepID=A0A3Q0EDC8_CARSF|nr:uncharacterized protein C4orf3 homolog [Carlito syrichta]
MDRVRVERRGRRRAALPGLASRKCAIGPGSVSGAANAEVRKPRLSSVAGLRLGGRSEMEVGAAAGSGPDGLRERRGVSEAGRQQQNLDVRPRSGANGLPKHSYWLDLWLFILFDVVFFFFVYFLP